MRRLAMTVRNEDVEDAYDILLEWVCDGVHERPAGEDRVELVWRGGTDDVVERLRAAAGGLAVEWADAEIDDAQWEASLRRSYLFGGRIGVRQVGSAAPPDGIVDVVIDDALIGFGSGSHPTTQACLELLAGLPAEGDLADLGCGSGVLAIAAAKLGYEPVFAIDYEQHAVAATRGNATGNGVVVLSARADLLAVSPPPAQTLVANVPLVVHEHVAANLDGATRRVIASGLEPGQALTARAAYEEAGLRCVEELPLGGWVTLRLERP